MAKTRHRLEVACSRSRAEWVLCLLELAGRQWKSVAFANKLPFSLKGEKIDGAKKEVVVASRNCLLVILSKSTH
jgi:hypothetical protein